jgi:superkiller protein 3
MLLAEAHIAAGAFDKARPIVEGLADADPQFWPAILMVGRVDLREGRFEEAASRARTVLSLRPTYIAAFLLAAEGLRGADKREEAQQMLVAAERVNPDSPDVQAALGDLKARFETEQYFTEALAHYGRALEKSPQHAHSIYGSAWVLERQKKFDEAEKKYRAYLDLVPNDPEAVNSIGQVLLKQGRVSEAQRMFQRALDLDENYITARANLGATYDAQAKYGDAIKLYEKILSTKGQDKNLRVLVNCAFDYEAMGAYPKAAKLLEQAHEVSPKDPDIMVWLGDNMYFQKKWKEAESWYQRAIAENEEHFFAWRGLGLAFAQRKRWADCVAAFEKASKLKPEDLDLYLTLGDIYYDELDDPKSALKAYQEYLQRGGNDPAVADTITELQKEIDKK